MDIKATIYDLLGYFVPGLIAIILSVFVFLQLYPMQNMAEIFEQVSEFLNIYYAVLLIIMSYLVGFIFSGLSNIYYKHVFKKRFEFFEQIISVKKLLSEVSFKSFNQKFEQAFNFNFSEDNIRILICYVENEKPILHSTALYYLSYYGMSRTLFFIFSLLSIVETILLIFSFNFLVLIYTIVSLSLSAIFLFQYIRFVKYYRKQIVYGFMI